jgi:hypothetical protein
MLALTLLLQWVLQKRGALPEACVPAVGAAVAAEAAVTSCCLHTLQLLLLLLLCKVLCGTGLQTSKVAMYHRASVSKRNPWYLYLSAAGIVHDNQT